MPILPKKNKENINQDKDLSEVKSAVQQPFSDMPKDMPPGLEDAPSPSLPPQEPFKENPEPPEGVSQEKTQIKTEIIEKPREQFEQPPERASFEVIEEIAESVISEKWEDLIKGVGDLKLWKEKVDTDLSGIKQEIVRVQTRFENLQNSIFGKVSEYGEGITEIGTEIRALEKVLEKIIGPLSKSVRDLQKITTNLKK